MRLKPDYRGYLAGGLLVFAFGLIASATAYAIAVQQNRVTYGALDGATYDAACTPPFDPTDYHTRITVAAKSTSAGTFEIQRAAKDAGDWNNLTDAGASTANVEDQHVIDFAVNRIRTCFKNSEADAGTFRVDYIQGN